MKTIIAGPRDLFDYEAVQAVVKESGFDITEIISGRATGVDTPGERYAQEHDIPLKLFPADWELYGRRAGYLRNRQMGEYADALILVWRGDSKGSRHMLEIAKELGLKIYEKKV